MQRRLTYCVSTDFGARYGQVVGDMDEAASAWEAAANVDFVHRDAEDGDCDASNPNVVFDVRPVNANGRYLARAFFPNEPRIARNILIDGSALRLNPTGKLQLVGVLRHELGHVLGFRHEHTCPSSGRCFEDGDWTPLTDYDPLSVMHYPQCNGLGDWSLTLTDLDRNGATCLYGPARGFDMDSEVCRELSFTIPNVRSVSSEKQFRGRVAVGEEHQYGPFRVEADTLLEARIEGDGDPDLYVCFHREPTLNMYDGRPLLMGARESCEIDVPDGTKHAYVMVHGYGAGSYRLTVVKHALRARP